MEKARKAKSGPGSEKISKESEDLKKHHVSKQMSLHFETDERRHVQLFIIHTHAQMSIAVCGGGGGGCSGTDKVRCGGSVVANIWSMWVGEPD